MLKEIHEVIVIPVKKYYNVNIEAGAKTGEFYVNGKKAVGIQIFSNIPDVQENLNRYKVIDPINRNKSYEVQVMDPERYLQEIEANRIEGTESAREFYKETSKKLVGLEQKAIDIKKVEQKIIEGMNLREKERKKEQKIINMVGEQAKDILAQQTEEERALYAKSAIERLRTKVNPKNTIVSEIFHHGSNIEVKIRDMWDSLLDYDKAVDKYFNENPRERMMLYGLGIAVLLDVLQSTVSGETIIRKIIRSPVRISNYLKGIEDDNENLYFRDLDGQRIYYNDIMPGPPVPNYGPMPGPPIPDYGPMPGPPIPPKSFERVPYSGRHDYDIDLNNPLMYDYETIIPGSSIRKSAPLIKDMYRTKEFPDSPVLPSQPGTIPEGTKYTLNNLMSEFPISGVDPEDKAYREMVLRLGRLYADVTSGARPDPTGAAGYIEPIQREYVEPRGMMLNNIVHRAPSHNIDIEQKQETLFNIPNKTVMDPQTLINRMKAKKGTKFTNIVGPARSTRESSLVESKRLER